jgi:cytochrome c-type biogenesis protein
MSGFRKHLGLVEKIAGALLVLSGLMFITGGVQAVSYWLIERFPVLLSLG